MEVKLEKFNYSEELANQRKLFAECFPETVGSPLVTEEHYNWKFKSFPTNGNETAYEYVAKLEDELIGYYAAIPYPYIVNSENVNAAMVCDVMTGVKARGKGVFTKLGIYSTNHFKEGGLAFSTGYPIRPEVIPGHKKAGWEFPFQIPMYGKFIRMNIFLRTKKLSVLAPFANLFITVLNRIQNATIKKNDSITIEKYQSNQISEINGFDDFISLWLKENPIALNKNTKFLSWRLGAPDKEYSIIILRSKIDNKIVAYSIFRNVEKEGVPCIGVLDFSFLKSCKKLSRVLLQQIEIAAKKEKAELILMMMMKQKAKEYRIMKNGFLKTPFPFSFIIKQFDESLNHDFLINESNWNLMWIDSDDL